MNRFSVALSQVDAIGRSSKSRRVEVDGTSRRDAGRLALERYPEYNRAEITHLIQPNGDAFLLPFKVTVDR